MFAQIFIVGKDIKKIRGYILGASLLVGVATSVWTYQVGKSVYQLTFNAIQASITEEG